jgi:hypothetical protein
MSSKDRTPGALPPRSVCGSLAIPHSFHPELGFWDALVAVAATLARIFGACVLFALWGGFSAWTWGALPGRFWRIAAVGPLVAIFAAALSGLMYGIGALQRRLRSGS